jgi:hypothetical protein
LGNNIDSDGTAGLGDPLDGVDPLLGALADNGGPIKTHALLVGSPAIDAGTAVGAPTVDQRGFTRDANVDIGSFEDLSGNTAPTADAGGPYVINEGDSLVVDASGSSDPDPGNSMMPVVSIPPYPGRR